MFIFFISKNLDTFQLALNLRKYYPYRVYLTQGFFLEVFVSAPFIKGHKLRKKIRNYEYENDRQRH